MKLFKGTLFAALVSALALASSDASQAGARADRTTYSGIVTDHAATCRGATPCRACKNCRYCKHCAVNGGTCGVCKR